MDNQINTGHPYGIHDNPVDRTDDDILRRIIVVPCLILFDYLISSTVKVSATRSLPSIYVLTVSPVAL